MDLEWSNLLSFLAKEGMLVTDLPVYRKQIPGRGFALCAARDLEPKDELFTLPPTALLNHSTVLSLGYRPKPSLSAVQLLSLHLMLSRSPPKETTLPMHFHRFDPYLSTLPRDFNFHPLTYLVGLGRSRQPSEREAVHLLTLFPPRVRTGFSNIYERFMADWACIQGYIKKHFPSHNAHEDDFCWAWLNVNTRCVYHRLQDPISHPDNLSLCPILDMANHTSGTATIIVQPISASSRRASMKAKNPASRSGALKVVLSSQPMEKDEELLLNYGPHPNCRLFVEYGFVDTAQLNQEVDIQDILEPMFNQQGDEGLIKRALLERENYWGEWTLHGGGPPFPSYRVTVALRLYRIAVSGNDIDDEPGVKAWRETVLGIRDCLPDPEECEAKETLKDICGMLAQRAQVFLEQPSRNAADEYEAWGQLEHCLQMLWREEYSVASALGKGLENGLEL